MEDVSHKDRTTVETTSSSKIVEELVRSRATLSSIIESTDDIVALHDPDIRLLAFNKACAEIYSRLFGVTLELGIRTLDLFPEESHSFWNEQNARALKGESFTVEFDIPLPDGSALHFESRFHPVKEDGVQTGFVTFTRDITERKLAESRLQAHEHLYRSLVEAQNDFIVRIDGRVRFTFVNEAYCRLRGLARDELIGTDMPPLHSEIDPITHEEMGALLRRPERRAVFEQQLETPEGVRWILWELSPIFRDDGSIAEIQCVGRDISPLKETQARVEAANRAKSEFLANMSHEIRTPLNAVIGFAELLKQTLLDPIQAGYIDSVQTSANALRGIIDDILDFSKIEAGRLELEHLETDLVCLVEEIVDIVKLQACAKGLELLLTIDPYLPRQVVLDPLRTRQVLVNLLTNAIKFTEQGEVELAVRFRALDEGRGHFLFTVRDTGIGIDDEQARRIFKPFSQADSSTTRRFGGTGLGLSIADNLIRRMGGSLRMESVPGSGTVFHVSFDLPCRYATPRVLPHGPARILLVAHHPTTRAHIEEWLRAWGLDCSCAEDIPNASTRLVAERFDAAIIDLPSAGTDGLQLARRIRMKTDSVRGGILLLHSPVEGPSLIEPSPELGTIRPCAKPLKIDALARDLSDILGQSPAVPVDPARTVPLPMDSRRASILIVEDVAMNRRLLRALVARLFPDGTILEASNGVEAFETVRDLPVDLVLMDIQMPVMDGLEATTRIRMLETSRSRPTRIPIVAITAGAVQGDRDRALACGIDEFLTKPIGIAHLEAMLHRLLDR